MGNGSTYGGLTVRGEEAIVGEETAAAAAEVDAAPLKEMQP